MLKVNDRWRWGRGRGESIYDLSYITPYINLMYRKLDLGSGLWDLGGDRMLYIIDTFARFLFGVLAMDRSR